MVRQLATQGRGSSRIGVSALGVVGALFVHALLVLPFVLDLSLPSRRAPDRNGPGASALFSVAEPEMTVVFVNELAPASALPRPTPDALASRGLESLDLPVVVLSSDDSPADQAAAQGAKEHQETPETSVSVPDPGQRALLYGRYLGQLQARIERAWMRPRTEIGSPRFSCRARIRQDRQGAVVGVEFDHCNGTQHWHESLLSAIRTASPLPAPPDASVFADVLWLSFTSEAFESPGSAQGFEPDVPQPARAIDQSAASESFQRFVNGGSPSGRRKSEDSKVLRLTIIGSLSGASSAAQAPPEAIPLPASRREAEPLPQ